MRVSEMRLYYTKLSPSFIHVTSNLKNATKDKSLYCTCLIDNLILSDSVVKSLSKLYCYALSADRLM